MKTTKKLIFIRLARNINASPRCVVRTQRMALDRVLV